jgi:hypothetical protein
VHDHSLCYNNKGCPQLDPRTLRSALQHLFVTGAASLLLGGGKKDGGWDGSGIFNARLAILHGLTLKELHSMRGPYGIRVTEHKQHLSR